MSSASRPVTLAAVSRDNGVRKAKKGTFLQVLGVWITNRAQEAGM